MIMLRYFVLFAAGLITFISGANVVIWNIERFPSDGSLVSAVQETTNQAPLVIFMKNKFRLSELSQAGDVYNSQPSGGSLTHLKDVMTHSLGYSNLHVHNACSDLKSLEKLVPAYSIVRTNAMEGDRPISDAAIIYVDLPDDIGSLDTAIPQFLERLGMPSYKAILMSSEDYQCTEPILARKKRAVSATVPPTVNPHDRNRPIAGWIMINKTGYNNSAGNPITNRTCLLVAQNITIVYFGPTNAEDASDKGKWVKTFWDLEVDPNNIKVDGHCFSAYNIHDRIAKHGSSNFDFELAINEKKHVNFPARKGLNNTTPYFPAVIKSIHVFMEFDTTRIGHWHMTGLSYTTNLDTTPTALNVTIDKYSGRSVLGGTRPHGYSCTNTGEFWKNTTLPPTVREPLFGVAFMKIKLQVYDVSSTHNFMTTFEDCTPFFTSGIWMGIISMLLYLMIVGFAMAMITNLKTMDRFENPKGKALVISFRE